MAIGSAEVLAKMLAVQGEWSDALANACDAYVNRVTPEHVKDKRRSTFELFYRVVSPLLVTQEQRKVLGRFISTHKGLAFQAGLRIGLGIRISQIDWDDASWGMAERVIREESGLDEFERNGDD